MHPILKNILAVIAGIVIGSLLNGGIIQISSSIIPPPPGVDVTTEEGLKAGIHLFKPINFLMPFLAHALGTLVGAFVAALIATKQSKKPVVLFVGLIFLAAGISMVFMLPSPIWFTIVDLVFAYLPMAWLGYLLAAKLSGYR